MKYKSEKNERKLELKFCAKQKFYAIANEY